MSRRFLLSLVALLLLCSLCGAQEYDGPMLPEGWYPISESQLTALDETLTALETQSQELRMQLNVASQQLDAAQRSLTNSMQQLDAAGVYLKRLETNVRTLTVQRNIAIAVAVITTIGGIVGWIVF